MSRDDDRLARVSRLIRREACLSQSELASSRFVAQEIEAGRSGALRVEQVRRHFAALGAKAQVTVWWNAAGLDRLLDQAHAQVVEAAAATLPRYGFRVMTEFTFNEFGERGSVDVFGGNEAARAVFVGEAKSEWGSIEETLRRQDLKARLAPKLASQAFGWRPRFVANVLILPNDRTARRVADRYAASLAAYPARAVAIRRWLASPTTHLGGIWFVSNAALVRHQSGDTGKSSVTRRTG